MRKRITYANVAATLALVLSMSGGAMAATHYLINSTKQINPKVLKKLKGATGPSGLSGALGPVGATGATGPAGAAGKEGKEGPKGQAGPLTTTLPSGETLRGTFAGRAFGKATQNMQIPISFGLQLSAAPTPHYLVFGEAATTECPGTPEEPAAAPGNLCIYESTGAINAEEIREFDPVGGANDVATTFGAGVVAVAIAEGDFRVRGSWAVTAP